MRLPARFSQRTYRPGWLAMAQDKRGWRWLHLVWPEGERPRVLAWAAGDNTQVGEAALGAALASIQVRGKLAQYRCLVCLGVEEYQIVQAELPSVPEEELRDSLRWAVRDMLDYAVDDIGADYLPVPTDPSRQVSNRNAFVICAQKKVLGRYKQAFAAQRAKLHVVDVLESAQRNLAALCGEADKGLALLGITHAYSMLSFIYNGELCASLRIEVGLSQLMAANADERQALQERVLLDVQRALDTFERQFYFAPFSRLLVSPLPDQIDLMPYLVDSLYQRVESLDLGKLIDLSAVPDLAGAENLALCLNVLGVALRAETAMEVA